MHLGERLRIEHGLNVQKAYYSQNGGFYNQQHYVPVALFDPEGYVIVHTNEEFDYAPFSHKQSLHVRPGIAAHPRYVQCVGHRHG